LATLLLAQGTPMLLAGDEFGRTQRGNNNAYCQDNETSWFDWTCLERHADVHRFVRGLIQLRQHRDIAGWDEGPSLTKLLQLARIEWHGVALGCPDWSEGSRAIALTLETVRGRFLMHLIFNAYWEALAFELPPPPPGSSEHWRRCIDTALPTPHDICAPAEAEVVPADRYTVQARSVVVLILPLRAHF
ncbi:MAG TPA: hypothetical protein VGQ57_13760, partial [Polyangiaceae bacterium]|nr:hypothetical protein [Polyangiaceae bacterium]